ncbi:MAG: hypothetical protein GEU71_12090 [Actinobacteria bacterium]|nr:hypothetical protein [Actinomycetota bacterium]
MSSDQNTALNLFELVRRWEQHCREAGTKSHLPLMEGGKATFDHNLARTYVCCCYKGCQWESTIEKTDAR